MVNCHDNAEVHATPVRADWLVHYRPREACGHYVDQPRPMCSQCIGRKLQASNLWCWPCRQQGIDSPRIRAGELYSLIEAINY